MTRGTARGAAAQAQSSVSGVTAADSQLTLPGLQAVEWVWCDPIEEAKVAFEHATIMGIEVIRALAPRSGVFVDATLGAGGHSELLLDARPDLRVIGFDRDAEAIEASRARLARFGDRVAYVHAPFSEVEGRLQALGVLPVRGLCADLGVSSPQLEDPARGMSFRHEGPIDMRMDAGSGGTALDLIARLGESELADVIFRYGDERRSRRIGRSIRRAYDAGELATTLDLRRAIVRAVGPVRIGGVDPATRTFQALRIAVNDELGEVERLLQALPAVLERGAVAAVLSFHSLEDRLVKHAFAGRDAWEPLTKKPLVATDDEVAKNPRARSAKLRAARFAGAGS